jgi:hypothetical protein
LRGIEDGEVLWIDAMICQQPDLPDGFPLRVVCVLDVRAPVPGSAWVQGVQLDALTGTAVRLRTLCVPIDQRRAVRTDRVVVERPAPASGRSAHVAAGRVPAGGARHRAADDERGLVGPPPGYRRREC